MSLTLSEIKDKFPEWKCKEMYINPHTLHVFASPSGLPIGGLYKDKSRCIYESYTYYGRIHVLENAKFLSCFKHKRLLTIKTDLYTRHIYVLQRIL